jgi:hypothetical protein
MKQCPQCGKGILLSRRTYCSRECASKANAATLALPQVRKAHLKSVSRPNNLHDPQVWKPRICEQCGNEYRSRSPRFCSQECVGLSTKLEPELRDARSKFFDQRCTSRYRGIPWDLTFEQWWEIWRKSGKWYERGRGKGMFQMARFNDSGAYAVGNVRITSVEENLAERELPRGESNPCSKLTEDDIREIRYLEGKMKRPLIAEKFGINRWHVRDIQKRRCWKHIE